ncbi:TPA: hypothetical protein HA249_04135 [Candidatus Woesearchaeota archaeon]|nr:hypothetical protein [Candidatus Woesearchaeota archaeon]HIH47083.1 hypothetical protein [Candidatus Woesearchaeota archaeon]
MAVPNTLSDEDLDERVQRILSADVSNGWNQPLEAFDQDLGALADGILSVGKGSFVLDERQQHVLKYGLLFAVHWYGDNRRKIGDHFYFNHVYKAAQWRVHLDGHKEKPYIFLTDLLSILFHDSVEEVVAGRLRQEKSSLQDRVLDGFSPEDRKLFTIFNQVAQIGGVGHLPTYLGDFDQYRARYKRSLPDDEKHGKSLRARIQKFLFSRDSFDHELKEQEGGYREQLSCDLLTYPHFVHYLQLAQHYIKALNDRVVARERKLIQEETLRFGTEFFKGLRQLPVPKKPLRKMASDVIASVYALTRVGSELYYQATGKLFAPQPRYRSLRTKYCDRLANSSDLRPSKRQTEMVVGGKPQTLRYFKYDPGNQRVDLVPFFEPSGNLTWSYDGSLGKIEVAAQRAVRDHHVQLRASAQELLADDAHLDLISFLAISENQTKFPGVQELDKQMYLITLANSEIHHHETVSEARARIKTRLPAPDRLYQLYKNLILVTHTRMFYEEKRVPTLISRAMGELLELTRAEAVHMVEGVFSNHCRPGGSLTLYDARRLYRELKEYGAVGGLDRITEEVTPRENTADRRPMLSYDGLLSRFFDKRVRGTRSATYPLYQDKSFMFAASLALHRLAERYIDDRRFYIHGLTFEGLRPEKSVMARE